jgi:transposase
LVTNIVAESLNGKVMDIKRRACSYRNKKYFQTAWYAFCGAI